MISPIGSTTPYQPVSPQAGPKPTSKPAPVPQDTVQLSRAAQKTLDVDHDGDSR